MNNNNKNNNIVASSVTASLVIILIWVLLAVTAVFAVTVDLSLDYFNSGQLGSAAGIQGIEQSPAIASTANLDPQLLEFTKQQKLQLQASLRARGANSTQKRLAVIIPYRDRERHLKIFAPYITSFLRSVGRTDFDLFVIEQTAKHRFNRGTLLNVGFSLLEPYYDYFAFNDVDQIPTHFENKYDYPKQNPLHLATCMGQAKYAPPPEDILCGAFIMTREQYRQVNGMSNKYWGWGWEDVDLYYRIKAAGLALDRLPDKNHGCIGRYEAIEENHDRDVNKDNVQLYRNLKQAYQTGGKLLKEDGLFDLKYKLVSIAKEEFFTRIVVELEKHQV